MYIIKLFPLILLLSSFLNAKPIEKVTLYLNWLHQFQFAGYYMAKENGYYSDLGIDLEMLEYSNNHDVTKQVINEKASYGIGNSSLVLNKFEGINIVLLSSFFQSSPLVLISLKNSNINTAKDLIKKNIMITDSSKESTSIRAMIASQGLLADQINIQPHSLNLDDLINKKADAMACYLSNEPFILNEKNIKYNILNPSDYGFDFYEGILFTSEDELKNHPIRVQNFNQASLRGWNYALNNIDETAKLIFEKYNTQNKSLESLIYEGNILKVLSKIDENSLGNINSQTIDEIKRFYTLLNLNNSNSTFDTKSILFDRNHMIYDDNDLEYLKNNDFTLLTESNFVPFSFKNLNELIGIEIDFWKLISEKLSKPFNIEEVIKDNFLNIFSNSIKVKFVYNFEKPFSDKFLYSNSIAKIPIALATKNNINFISDLASLNDVKIAVLKDLNITETLKKNYPNITFVEISSIDDGIYRLKNNMIFALIDNLYVLSHKIEKLVAGELKINSTLDYKINIFLEVKKRNEQFIKIINNTIDSLSDNEKNAIINNYQLILYHNNIDYVYLLKFIIPLIVLLSIFIFFNYRLKNEIKRREEIEIKLSNLANNDSLTGIFNRRKIEELCEIEIKRSDRYSNELSIIFFDVNDFKIINDKLGHHKGDEVLIKIAEVIGQNIRSTDYFGRWGGDEFLIVLPQTNLYKTEIIITTLENLLNDINIDLKIDAKVSCSFGLSQYEEDDTLDTFIKRADESMYKNKTIYRNSKAQYL